MIRRINLCITLIYGDGNNHITKIVQHLLLCSSVGMLHENQCSILKMFINFNARHCFCATFQLLTNILFANSSFHEGLLFPKLPETNIPKVSGSSIDRSQNYVTFAYGFASIAILGNFVQCNATSVWK